MADGSPKWPEEVQSWGPEHAKLFESGRMSWRARSCLDPWTPLMVPSLGAITVPTVFLIRIVLHDWNDEDAAKILPNIRSIMQPSSKILIRKLHSIPSNLNLC